jgi:hypothetical protein
LEHPDDFSPITEHGEVKAPVGIFGRLTGQRDLPTVGLGIELVLTGKDGKPIAGGAATTAGEKSWAKAASWIKVDTSEHTLEFKIPFRDPTGLAGFDATVTVGAAVANSSQVASLGVTSVKDFLEPLLNEEVTDGSKSVAAITDDNPIAALNEARSAAEAALREKVRGAIEDAPPWIKATVKSINVAFDAATNTHYDELVERGREKQRIDAVADNEELETQRTIKRDALWREALSDHLSDPGMRSFEAVFRDPTPQNIDRAVQAVNASEAADRELTAEILTQLITKNHLHDWGEVGEAVEQIRQAIKGGNAQGGRQALNAPDTEAVIDVDAHTTEHEQTSDESAS